MRCIAPSAINLLAPQNCDTIRTTLLANPEAWSGL